MRYLLTLLLLAMPLAAEEPLTNADVVRMLKDGVPPSVVTAKIKTSSTRFELTTDAIVNLTKAGVPESVLTAMIESTTPAPPAATTSPALPSGPDMLMWKQECEATGWPDYVCRPGEPFIVFPKVIFYREGARTPGATGALTLSHHRLSATAIGRAVFDIPWEDVTTFCTEFGVWRNMVYLHAKDGEIKFDLGGQEDRLAKYLRRILQSVKTEKCEQ